MAGKKDNDCFPGFLDVPSEKILLYLGRNFGRKFVIYVGKSDTNFSLLLAQKYLDIDTEIRLRVAYCIAKMLASCCSKKLTKAWFCHPNDALCLSTPSNAIRCALSFDELQEVMKAAKSFCLFQ